MAKEVLKVKKTPSSKTSSKKSNDFKKSILYVTSEVQPFCATGGLADVCGSLPNKLKEEYPGSDIRVILPLYKNMKIEREKLTYLANTYVNLSWRKEYCGIFTYTKDGVVYYFLDNEKYFKRDNYYGYGDDAERFAFFSKSVLEVLPILDFYPEIIHCNDWQSALVPVYLKTYNWNNPKYNEMKTIITIHNILYQGRYGREILSDVLGFDQKDAGLLLHHGDVNFMKASMLCADRVTTVSDSYSKEIQTPEGGNGLDDIARQVSYKLSGIVNGLDYTFYNPSIDKAIWVNYDSNTLEDKAKNKEELQKFFNVEVNPDVPVLSLVTRLVQNKGLDFVRDTIEGVLNSTDAQLVAIGTGDKQYEDFLNYLNRKYPNRVGVYLGFVVDIGKKIYAGSDIFMMPSISEPCGLSQMIASRYGAVPLVREVGGLKDTIKDFGCIEGGNGYTFHDCNSKDFEYSLRRAINDYHDKKAWTDKIKTVMKKDFSWSCSMNNYVNLYKQM